MNTIDLFRLDGKTALVTGCSRGIGFATATALAEVGADIVGVSRSLESVGNEIRRAVEAAGRKFYDYSVDFGKRPEVYRFIDRLMKDSPIIDIVVIDAGYVPCHPANGHPKNYWEELLDTHLNSHFELSREIGETMVERRSGKIIFADSPLLVQGGTAAPAYVASNGTIGRLTKALANEWAPYNVQVNAIAAGYIATDHTATVRADPVHNSAIRAQIPAGRWGTPEDLQGVTVFLASWASDYLSGSVIVVDGGWTGRQDSSDHAAGVGTRSTLGARVGVHRHCSIGTRSDT